MLNASGAGAGITDSGPRRLRAARCCSSRAMPSRVGMRGCAQREPASQTPAHAIAAQRREELRGLESECTAIPALPIRTDRTPCLTRQLRQVQPKETAIYA